MGVSKISIITYFSAGVIGLLIGSCTEPLIGTAAFCLVVFIGALSFIAHKQLDKIHKELTKLSGGGSMKKFKLIWRNGRVVEGTSIEDACQRARIPLPVAEESYEEVK